MPEKKQNTKSAILTPDALAVEIKNGALGSYIFFGEEDYLKTHYRDEIYKSIMEEGFEIFNYFPISFSPAVQTKEEAMSRLADAVQAIPMMQDKKLIVASDLALASLSKDLLDASARSLATMSFLSFTPTRQRIRRYRLYLVLPRGRAGGGL